jgi:hypothetical protein
MSAGDGIAPLRRRLEQFLADIVGDVTTDAAGDVAIRRGSATVWIRPMELPDGRSAVRLWAITNRGIQVDEELTRFVVTENARLVFGALAVDEQLPAVVLGHTLLGEFLNRVELETALDALAASADELDDRIATRFGGKTFTER